MKSLTSVCLQANVFQPSFELILRKLKDRKVLFDSYRAGDKVFSMKQKLRFFTA